MKAAVLETWNQLALKDIEMPVPEKDEALIKVIYGGVCGSDITVYKGLHPTAISPVVLCHEILGVIEQLPEGYNGDFKVGQRVLMNPVISCGTCAACQSGYGNVCSNLKLLGIHVNGGFEEYTKVSVDKLVSVDAELPDTTAVLGEPFAVAYHVNSRAGIKKNDKVLIAGAGTIGIVVALVAQYKGADVYLSEINEDRIKLANELGLKTMNPMQCDLMEEMRRITNGIGFDVVIDASGAKASVLTLPDLGRVRGTLMSLGLSGVPYEFLIGKVSFKEQTLIGSRLYSQEDFEAGVKVMTELAAKTALNKVVTDIMQLDDIVEAIELMKSGKNIGKIIVKCN